MTKAAYYFTFLFVVVATGTISSLGPLGSFVRLAAIPAICLTLLNIYLRGTCRRLDIYHWAFFLFVLWNIASYFWSASPEFTQEGLVRFIPLIVTTLVIWENCRTRQRVEGLMQAFVCGGCLIMLALSFNYASGNSATTDTQRVAAGGFNPDDFLYLIPVPVAWYLARRPHVRNKFLVVLNLSYVLIAPLGIIFTATRAALLVAVPGYLYILWSGRKAPASWKIAFVVAAILLVGLTSQLDIASKLTRLSTIAESSNNTGSSGGFDGRSIIWELAIKEFSHNPIVGIGSDAFSYISASDPTAAGLDSYRGGLPVHNTYLSVLTETGIIGFMLMASAFAIVIRSARALKETDLKYAFITALTMMAVGISSLTYETHAGLWILCVLVVASAHATGTICLHTSIPLLRDMFVPTIRAKGHLKLGGTSN